MNSKSKKSPLPANGTQEVKSGNQGNIPSSKSASHPSNAMGELREPTITPIPKSVEPQFLSNHPYIAGKKKGSNMPLESQGT